MKLKHSLLAVALLFSGSAFSQISNQITNAETANAWISGLFRANTGFDLNAVPGSGGYSFYNSNLTTGSLTSKLRWVIRGQNTETGSNAGYDFSILRRDDAGNQVDIPFQIMRQTGAINMPGIVNLGQNSTINYQLRILGNSTGASNNGGISIYENNNTTRTGFFGDPTAGNSDMYVISDFGGVTLFPTNGIVNILGNTSNMLLYRNVGIQAPTLNTRSAGTKAVWFPAGTPATQADFATGIESGYLWNSVPGNNLSYGFKWYGGTAQVAKLDGNGDFETVGLLRLGIAGSERLSAGLNAIGFNRDVTAGTIFSNTGHAYQFAHAASTTATADRFDLRVYNPSGTAVTLTAFSVNGAGNIGIGVTPRTNYKLAVAGDVAARKIKVTQETWADYVFKPGYKLPSIAETEAFINANKHLPGIPSEKEVMKEGIDVGEMNKLLLQKIEEQMLYIIEMNKEIKALKEEVKAFKND